MSSLKRIILEMGTGTDLHGGNYTKAASRAVMDALHHSSLSLFRTLDIDPELMQIELKIAVQEPEKVDLEEVSRNLPYGQVSAEAVQGGLNIHDPGSQDFCIIANASIIVRLPLNGSH